MIEPEDIYSSVPMKHGVSEEEIERVRGLLEDNPRVWILTAKIAAFCAIEGRSASTRRIKVTEAVTNLVERDGLPIVAGKAGFCYAVEPNMLKVYLDNLEKRRLGLVRRIEAVERIRAGMTGPQFDLRTIARSYT
jgi:hypothetical protein